VTAFAGMPQSISPTAKKAEKIEFFKTDLPTTPPEKLLIKKFHLFITV